MNDSAKKLARKISPKSEVSPSQPTQSMSGGLGTVASAQQRRHDRRHLQRGRHSVQRRHRLCRQRGRCCLRHLYRHAELGVGPVNGAKTAGTVLDSKRIVTPNYSTSSETYVCIDGANAFFDVVAPLMRTCSPARATGPTVRTGSSCSWPGPRAQPTTPTSWVRRASREASMAGSYRLFQVEISARTPGAAYLLAPQWAADRRSGDDRCGSEHHRSRPQSDRTLIDSF